MANFVVVIKEITRREIKMNTQQTTKNLFYGCLLFVLASMVAQPLQARRKVKNEDYTKVTALVRSGNFTVKIDRVYPMRGFDTTRFNPSGSFTIKGDTLAKGDLPFFGEAYRASFSSEGGVVFDGPVLTRSLQQQRKALIYKFSVASKENDELRFNVRIFSDGTATVDLSSNYLQHISYSGTVGEVEQTN